MQGRSALGRVHRQIIAEPVHAPRGVIDGAKAKRSVARHADRAAHRLGRRFEGRQPPGSAASTSELAFSAAASLIGSTSASGSACSSKEQVWRHSLPFNELVGSTHTKALGRNAYCSPKIGRVEMIRAGWNRALLPSPGTEIMMSRAS